MSSTPHTQRTPNAKLAEYAEFGWELISRKFDPHRTLQVAA